MNEVRNITQVFITYFVTLSFCFRLQNFGLKKSYRKSLNMPSKLWNKVNGEPVLSSEEVPTQPRIVGGRPAKFGQIPYQMEIIIHITARGENICGGSLIDYCGLRLVITAAHCLWDLYENKKVEVVGADLNINNYSPREQWFKTRHQVVHPDYDPRFTLNDIGIIVLETYACESLGLERIQLPESNWEDPGDVQVSGWGADHWGGTPQSELQVVEVPTLPWEYCKELPITGGGILGPKQFCMTNGDIWKRKGPCQGDSGGPVVGFNFSEQKWYLAGVVSFSMNFICGDAWSASVATRVTNYVDWIKGFAQGWLDVHGTGNPFHNQSHCKP